MTYKITNVPIQRDFTANNCVPASVYMILKHLEITGKLESSLMSYNDFLSLFPKVKRIGYAPGKIKDYLSNNENLDTLNIVHSKANSILDLEHLIRHEKPVIVIYDNRYFQTQIEGSNMHFSVMVGYTPENILVNDLFHGANYSLSRDRFIEAWNLRQRKYILVVPPRQSLKGWMK